MKDTFTPKQIANELNISSTTLRRYEALGLIPDVPRTNSQHRFYHRIHLQAFVALRSLLKAYEYQIVYEVMREIKQDHVEDALWLVNHQQYLLQIEKHRIEEILNLLKRADFPFYKNINITDNMRIGEVAKIAGINTSAIRHWENEELIQSARDPENGYRVYSKHELKKILVISSLRKTIYFIDHIKTLLDELESQNIEKVEQTFQLAIQNLNNKLAKQFKAITELTNYLDLRKTDGK